MSDKNGKEYDSKGGEVKVDFYKGEPWKGRTVAHFTFWLLMRNMSGLNYLNRFYLIILLIINVCM